ncbi:MAG: ABC transporter [candidate division Zixibacteria bacterium RBG_16_48_11]|nr:MAG: ABC transporter [candidate division Zixibacteria bacterium RBG_16_48_11]
MDAISFLAAPFVAGLVLAGILAYLGLHVVERGVIFVDLAMAQVAALGATVGVLFGLDFHSPAAYWWSLGFTLVAALVVTKTRSKDSHIPQEAFIGIVYIVSAALAILIMSKAPHGGEHLRDMLVGNILTVTWPEVAKTASLYGVIGFFHWVSRKRLLLISLNPERARAEKLNVGLWDLLFYVSFGFVVTSAVSIAGVLLVFSYLVIPAVCAMLFAEKTSSRLVLGWVLGTLVSVAGVGFSYLIDLPTGATIVVTFGMCLVICVGVKRIFFGTI